MEILDTTVIPDEPDVFELREFYQNEPRVVQVTIIGTGEVTLYGRLGNDHTFMPLLTVDEDFIGGLFLPRHIKAVPNSIDGRIVVSVNISGAVTVGN